MAKLIYRHTQSGYLLMIALGGGLLAVLYILVTLDFHWVGVFVFTVLALCFYTFSGLTVEVTGEEVRITFRGGFIRRRFPIHDIQSVRPVRSPWYYGWGLASS